MTKNIKSIFFVLTLVMLLVTVGAVSAADDANSTATSDNSISDVATVSDSASDTVAAEPVQTTSNNKVDTKTIEKEDKNLKTETSVVNVSNYNTLKTAINDNNDENLIINLQQGDYYISWETWTFNKENVKKVIINGNNNSMTGQLTLSTSYEFELNNINIDCNFISNNLKNVTINSSNITGFTFRNNGNITLNNINRSSHLQSYNNGNMSIFNSTLNGTIENNENAILIINDDMTLGSKFGINGVGQVITNKTILPYMNTYTGNTLIENFELSGFKTNKGNLVLNNVNLKAEIINNGNLTLKNVTINGDIINNGDLIICDDVIFGDNCVISDFGNIIINNSNILLPYLTNYNGTVTLENMNITRHKNNYGNLTIKNSIINNINNYGNLTLINTTLNGQSMYVYGNVYVGENVTVNDSNLRIYLYDEGTIISNDTSILSPYIDEYINGNYTIKNTVITAKKTNNANLTITNSTIDIDGYYYDNQLTNNGNLTVNNTTINSGIINNQNLNIIQSLINSTIEYKNNVIIENSTINTTQTNKGNLTLINNTLNSQITNNNNLHIKNTIINYPILNYQILIIENSTINTTLTNNGNLYIADDVIFAENTKIEGTGNITINDTSKITPYLDTYPNGNYTIKDITINTLRTNNGNLTIINSTINGVIDNNNNLQLNNCTLNNILINKGNLTIGDNVIFGDNFKIYGTGEININDSDRIAPYTESYNLSYKEVKDFDSFKFALILSASDYNNKILVIKLLEGEYFLSRWDDINVKNTGTIKKVIIEGNNQIINANHYTIQYTDMENFIVNDLTLNMDRLNLRGNVTLEINNSTINCTVLTSNGTLIIDENTIIDPNAEFWINNVTINDINRILPYTINIYSNINIENFIFNNEITFNANTDLSNCTINSTITNNGNITLNNSNLNKAITNNGNLTLINCTIDENTFRISGNGNVTCDDLAKYFPYITYVKGEYELNDYTINKSFTNNGQITLNNCILNSSITNNGILIINDETVLGENLMINGEGEIIINDTNKIAPYLTTFNGNYTLENTTINSTKTNLGNLTIINSILNGTKRIGFSNNGNLTIKNSTLNLTIINNGNLTITDDCIIGENCQIRGNGQLIMNDTTRIGIYSGNIIKDNTVINSSITIPNDGNVTFTNSNITAPITNNGNLTFTNCLINAQITNYANLTLNNCSLSNNNMSVSGSKIDGFLINNQGNTDLINCHIENNTFNTTQDQSYLSSTLIIGAISNKVNMNVVNCTFYNNTVGYAMITDKDSEYQYDYGVYIGDASCIYNNGGNLTIDNSLFKENYAGHDAGAILSTNNYTDYWHRNLNSEANLLINNTNFVNNTATGSGGALVLSDKNNHIINSEFTENQIVVSINAHDPHLGGAIEALNGTLIIDNTTFNNNKFITESQSWVSNIGSIIYSNTYVNLTIDNSKFNNDIEETVVAEDIKITSSYLNNTYISTSNNYQAITIINNNTFTNNSSLSISTNVQNELNQLTISNNIFQDNNYTTNTITITNINDLPTISYKNNNTYLHTGLNDTLTLNTPNKIFAGEPVTITGTYTINNPEYYDENILEQNKFELYINGKLTQILDTLEFTITPTAGNMIITVQPSISSLRKTISIRSTTLSNITITPENYEEYIYEGALIGVGQNSKITFQGEFTDKGEIYIDTSDIIVDGSNATFTNTKFVLDAENIVLQNMNINNTDMNYPIANYKDNNIITNNTIILINTNDKATAIYNTASNTIIANNTLTVEGLAGGVDWDNPEGGVADTQAILLLGGNNNTIQNNTINIKSTQATGFNTLEAITNNNGATNTLITQNKINISGANFNYAIDSINNVENITITENTITATGERYCDGIQTGNNAKNILIDNNNITCVCINTTELTSEGAITYGVIGTMLGGNGATNMTVTNNNINLTGTANYGIELYWVNTTETHNNNITVNGPFSMGIGYAYSPNGNATQNTITINGDSTTPINQITEEFKPENVGIRIQNGTNNISITENTITTSDVGGKDTTINSDPDNVTIANNKLTSSKGYGDNTIKAPTTANIENNTIETTTTITVPETVITNTPVTLTATVTVDKTPLTSGVVTFTKGNEVLAQATVTDGIATAIVTFTQEEDSTITATYTPESTGLSTSSDEATTSIQNPITQLNIEDVNLTAGETVTLTATVIDQAGNNITGGKVVFKVNGKTVKDANGKVVYAKVVNGVATVEYTVPDSLAGKDVNITAVYSGSTKYNKESTTITKTVITPEATLTITPITDDVQTGSTITLKAKVAVGDQPITTGKIVFKINGKTVKDENGKVIYAKVDSNGEVSIDYILPESYKTGNYTIEATFIAPGYDKITTNTTMTVVKA